jgi:hypothetical protein
MFYADKYQGHFLVYFLDIVIIYSGTGIDETNKFIVFHHPLPRTSFREIQLFAKLYLISIEIYGKHNKFNVTQTLMMQ